MIDIIIYCTNVSFYFMIFNNFMNRRNNKYYFHEMFLFFSFLFEKQLNCNDVKGRAGMVFDEKLSSFNYLLIM